MSVEQILKWAAGHPVRPVAAAADETSLLRLVELHALAPRFLRRLKEENAGWATGSLRAGLAELAEATEVRSRRHLDSWPGTARPSRWRCMRSCSF